MTLAKVDNRYLIGAVMVLLAAAMFASKGIMIKMAYQYEVSALTVLALRMLFSMPVYLGMAVWTDRTNPLRLTQQEWVQIVALGICGYYLSSLFDFMALNHISVGLERLSLFLYPTITLLILAFWKKRAIQGREWVALGVCYGGIALAFWQDVHIGSWSETAQGMVLMVLCDVAFAIYIVGTGELVSKLGTIRFTSYVMLVSSIGVLVHFVAVDHLGKLVQPWPVYAWCLAIALLATVIPSFIQSEGIRRVGSGRAGILGAIGPVVTVLLGTTVLHEPVGLLQILGLVLVTGGVVSITLKK